MTKRVLNDPDASESSEGSKNKRKKSDEERGLPLQKYTFSRKCKVSTLLKEPFKIYGQLFRTTAVEFMIFRRDTMHFLNFLVLNRAASGYNLATFPDITAPILWSHSYKLMVNDTKNSNSWTKPVPVLTQSLLWFNIFVLTQIQTKIYIIYLLWIIYILLLPQVIDGKKIWYRDINAAINIRGRMMDYINSRHPSLCRSTSAVVLPTATSLFGRLFTL